MLGFIIVLILGIIITFWFLTRNPIKKDDLPDQEEVKSFRLLEVLEGKETYVVKFKLNGQEAWRKVSKEDTDIKHLGNQSEYQRFDIIETTSYYVEKRWFREDRKLCRIETSYKIFVSPDSYFPKEF